MRQYAGFGSAEESNARYRYLLSQGTTGLSVAFDLPTQMGLDPDHPLATGEVGRVGVSIASLDDMRKLARGHRALDKVSTSMTDQLHRRHPARLLLPDRKEQGADPRKINGTIQNDILDRIHRPRHLHLYPPRAALRIVTDVFAWAVTEVPEWNTISISGYHIREAGSTAVQEVAFTFANAIAYIEFAWLGRTRYRRTFAPAPLVLLQRAHGFLVAEIAKVPRRPPPLRPTHEGPFSRERT